MSVRVTCLSQNFSQTLTEYDLKFKILDRLIILSSRTTASKKSTELFFKFLFLGVFLTFVRLSPQTGISYSPQLTYFFVMQKF